MKFRSGEELGKYNQDIVYEKRTYFQQKGGGNGPD